MSAPPPVDAAGGLAEGAGASVDIVLSSLSGALLSTLAVVAPILIGAAVIVALVLTVVGARRVRREIAEARRQTDPRDLVDPNASDVLGEWEVAAA